jgi:hypothetical protein
MGWHDFSLAAVGCWYDNEDGSSRQLELRECQPGDPIALVRQPDNPHDDRAVAIVTGSGTCVGFLKRDRAAWIAPKIDRGYDLRAIVERVKGAHLPDATLGLVIRISMDLPGNEAAEPELGGAGQGAVRVLVS